MSGPPEDDGIEIVHEWVDPLTNVLWQRVRTAVPGPGFSGTRAVCRPESCADGHRCGKLDIEPFPRGDDEFLTRDADGNTIVPADPIHPEPDPDPFGYGSVIRPGHPLYGQVFGQQIIEATLRDAGLVAYNVEAISRAILFRLARHDPPILLCTPDEMKD